MDCDRVFMILTRGPFPTGEPSDEAVEAHLETCAECWRLAEALRPALEVFQEAIPPAETRNLPGYWGDARPTSHMVAALARRTTRTALAPGDHRIRPMQLARDRHSAGKRPAGLLRALAVAAMVTAAALVLMLLVRG